MSITAEQMAHQVRRYLGARSGGEFFGREDALERLTLIARDTARGARRQVALCGPHGAGKSELLRQWVAEAHKRRGEVVPLYVDLATMPGEDLARTSDLSLWRTLILALIRQLLAYEGKLSLMDPIWLRCDPAQLTGICYGAGLSGLAPFIATVGSPPGGLDLWRSFLDALGMVSLPPLVLVIDGLEGETGGRAERILPHLLNGARRYGCSLIFENEANEPLAAAGSEPLEKVALEPLSPEAAGDLTMSLGRQGVWSLDPGAVERIMMRLGPWPGWVRSWAAQVRSASAVSDSPRRIAEQAYIDLIATSAWSDRLRQCFDAAVTAGEREAALRLVAAAAESEQPLGQNDVEVMLGGSSRQVRWIDRLVGLGLLTQRGTRLGGPRCRAQEDWARLTLAESHDPAGPEGARLELLTRLLAQTPIFVRDPDADSLEVRPDRLLPELLLRFRGQSLPSVLFDYGNFYEALGSQPSNVIRETIGRQTSDFQVPEVVGVAPWRPFRRPVGEVRYYYARAYREGRYQRSYEQTWLLADLSGIMTLTTPEIEAVREAGRELEQRLGPGQYRTWLVVGDTASPDAINLMQKDDIFCSNLQQLALIAEMLPGRGAPETKARSAEAGAAGRSEGDGPRGDFIRRPVIEVFGQGSQPQAEVSSLLLPAREDSELIAAQMAEKIAIRADFEPAEAGKIKTAVLEGVLNAAEHSSNHEKQIDIKFVLKPEYLEILIENEGNGFDPLAVPTPEAQDKIRASNKRGWGISLMKRFMDEVSYEPCPRGTRLRLLKRRGGLARVDGNNVTVTR